MNPNSFVSPYHYFLSSSSSSLSLCLSPVLSSLPPLPLLSSLLSPLSCLLLSLSLSHPLSYLLSPLSSPLPPLSSSPAGQMAAVGYSQQGMGGYSQPGQPPYYSSAQHQPAAPSQTPYMQPPAPLPQQVGPHLPQCSVLLRKGAQSFPDGCDSLLRNSRECHFLHLKIPYRLDIMIYYIYLLLVFLKCFFQHKYYYIKTRYP